MKIDKNNRSIINFLGAPLIVASIMYSYISFLCLVFVVITFSFYEFLNLLYSKSKITIKNLILGFLWISSFAFLLPIYKNIKFGPIFILIIFLAVWITDSFAFIFGKKFGVKKIFPSVSPNKTWIGCVAGLISSIFFIFLVYTQNIFPKNFNLYDALILGIITGVFGQYGDYIESLFKRKLNIKDSSNFLLGHGGFLDRFDSLFIVSYFTFVYMLLSDLAI